MSACRIDAQPPAQWRGLEPEGRGHELMLEWASYRRGGDRGRSPISPGSWSEPLAKAHDGEPEYLIRIDRYLASLTASGLHAVVGMVKRYYLGAEHFWEVAEHVRKTEGFVRLTLRGVCNRVEELIA